MHVATFLIATASLVTLCPAVAASAEPRDRSEVPEDRSALPKEPGWREDFRVRRAPSPMPVSRWPRSGRYGTPQGRGTPPRTKETPCWIRDARPRALRARWVAGHREGRPYAASSPMPVSRWPRSGRHGTPRGRGTPPRRRKRSRAGFGMGDRAPSGRDRVAGWATARVAPTRPRRPCRFPDGLVRVGTGRHEGVGRHLARRQRSRAGFGMGDRAPSGRDRVAGWATARVAPTRPRRPCRFPDGLVRVGTGRHEGVGRHLARRQRSRAGFGMATARPPGAIGSRDGRPRGSPLRGPRRPCRFPDGLVRVGTDATRAWDATSHEGNEAVLDSACATARPPGAIGSRDGRPRGSPLRGLVAHAGFPRASFGSARDAYGQHRRAGVTGRSEAKPRWIVPG